MTLERDNVSSNRRTALSFCLSMIFSENRFPLFRIMLYRLRSVVVAAVVTLHQSIVPSGGNIFLVEAAISSAKCCLLIAAQMFKMQFDQVRIVEISREVVSGVRWMAAAYADDRIPNFGGQTIDMFRIPGVVVSDLTAASECVWLIAK